MFYVVIVYNNIVTLKRTFTELTKAQAYGKMIHGIIRSGGVEGQTINDYRR